MKGKLKDLSFGRNGEQIITLAVDADFTEQFDELKDFDVDIEIKKHRKMRTNEANKYCWVLCEKIAQRLSDEKVKHMKQHLRYVMEHYSTGELPLDYCLSVIRSYLGIMQHCDCDALRNKILQDFVLVRNYADEHNNEILS